MTVVLEGPDGSGKTTLAEALVKALDCSYIHCGPPEKPALDFYMGAMRGKLPAVVDRLHVGSNVYGKVFRGRDDLTAHEHWIIDGYLFAHDAMLVYCKPTETALDAILGRPPADDDAAIYEDPAKQDAVRSAYDAFIRDYRGVPVRRYDYTIPGELERTVELLAAKHSIDALFNPLNGLAALGNPRLPRHVFVGDQPSTRPRALRRARAGGWDVARYMKKADAVLAHDTPFNSASGKYLGLALATVPMVDYLIINSVQFDGSRFDEKLDLAYFPSVVDWVALGRNASEVMEKAGVDHRVVPHPQHVKRFHYKRVSDYKAALLGTKPWECGTDFCARGEW